MDLENYEKWLEANGNKEESAAREVVNEIIEYHTRNIKSNISSYEISCFPRKIYQTKKEKLEFDLIIVLEWQSNRHFRRVIGVEFKETDFAKVVVQAIARRDFVDYMYVATRNVIPELYDLFRLLDFGIGWVVWDDKFAKLIFPAKFHRHSQVMQLIDYLARKALEEHVEEMKREENIVKLFNFI